jgi:acetyl-CoA carboxylase biotin carboxyl carrier protein
MNLSKITTLIDFVGQSNITELTVTEKDTTVRIFRTRPSGHGPSSSTISTLDVPPETATSTQITAPERASVPVHAPIFGVLHTAPAPGESTFIRIGDTVGAGQTLFIIEAMKVFNAIVAPQAGRVLRITAIDGSEVEAGDLLAEMI